MYPSIFTTDPFGDLLGLRTLLADAPDAGAPRSWTPAVDWEDRGDHYVVRADLPGIKPADVGIELDHDVLRIKGERRAEPAPEGGDARRRRIERAHGVFERSLRLPEDADPDAVEARGEHGVLHVRIGKQAAVAPRRIEVRHD